MDYLEWNNSIAAHFFRPASADQRVYLYVTRDTIEQIGRPSGDCVDDFIQAVITGPEWATRQGLCQKAFQAFQDWRDRDLGFPPYIAFLALFVLAGGHEGDFARHAYYPRLRDLIGEERNTGPIPSFNKMWELWTDLEVWSNVDRHGDLGIFTADVAGSWIHVGLPLAQTLLTEEETRALHWIFVEGDLEPSQLPSRSHLTSVLVKHGRQFFRPRTCSLLETADQETENLHDVLVERILAELREWDGTTFDDMEDGPRLSGRHGLLVLCMTLDRAARKSIMSLRCRHPHEYPPEGLTLRLDAEAELTCVEHTSGLSTPLRTPDDSIPFDASRIHWGRGCSLQDATGVWRLRLPARSVRVFVDAASFGITGLIEQDRLPRGRPFYVAVDGTSCEDVIEWITTCNDPTEIPVDNGFPIGWRLFSVNRASSTESLNQKYSNLSTVAKSRLSFEGLRISRGSRFFSFAPPRIVIESEDPDPSFCCNDAALRPLEEPDRYGLPKGLPSGRRLEIQKREDGEKSVIGAFYLEEGRPWASSYEPSKFDSYGQLAEGITEDSPVSCGALVTRVDVPDLQPHPLALISTHALDRSVFLVGRRPGQVSTWPTQPLPEDWSPIWIITSGRRGKALFCGTGLAGSEPVANTYGNRQQVSRWKDLLWHKRKKITPPPSSGEHLLWEMYQKAGKHALAR